MLFKELAENLVYLHKINYEKGKTIMRKPKPPEVSKISGALKRNRRVGIVLTADEFNALDKGAKQAKQSLNSYIIGAIMLRSKKEGLMNE